MTDGSAEFKANGQATGCCYRPGFSVRPDPDSSVLSLIPLLLQRDQVPTAQDVVDGTGGREAPFILANLISQTLTSSVARRLFGFPALPGGGIRSGFVCVGFLPAVPGPKLTPSARPSQEEA